MPTFTQVLLLGSERASEPPSAPHAALEEAWARIDWIGSRDAALLAGAALAGAVRQAGCVARRDLTAAEPAPSETWPYAPERAVALLRQLVLEEGRPLLTEWLELCARAERIVPPFYLRALFELGPSPEARAATAVVGGERGRWLARQNPAWSWVVSAAQPPARSVWETGDAPTRIALLRALRATDPATAASLAAATWAEDAPEFRAEVIALFGAGLSSSDEPLLTRALTDRRKEVRTGAQALLSRLGTSVLAQRMNARAEVVLQISTGAFGNQLLVHLPPSFDASWKADGIEEKAPAGIGEKAFWARQILGCVAPQVWRERTGLDSAGLVALAAKSEEWGDLVLGAWYRATIVHRDAAFAAVLIRIVLGRAGVVPMGLSPEAAALQLLELCPPADRWGLVGSEPSLAWGALPLLTAPPSWPEARSLLREIAPHLRAGYNPGGSSGAMLAARRLPPAVRDEAAELVAQDSGLSKPAEAFLRALELRAEMHSAFATTHSSPLP